LKKIRTRQPGSARWACWSAGQVGRHVNVEVGQTTCSQQGKGGNERERRDNVTKTRTGNEGVEREGNVAALSYGGRVVLGYFCRGPPGF